MEEAPLRRGTATASHPAAKPKRTSRVAFRSRTLRFIFRAGRLLNGNECIAASSQKGDRVRTPSENPSWRRPLTAADLIGIPQSESDAEAARRSLQSVVNVAKSLSAEHEWQTN